MLLHRCRGNSCVQSASYKTSAKALYLNHLFVKLFTSKVFQIRKQLQCFIQLIKLELAGPTIVYGISSLDLIDLTLFFDQLNSVIAR